MFLHKKGAWMNTGQEPLSGRISDQNYLKEQQYRTADNLQARINLHRFFGTNDYPWQRWVLDHLPLKPGYKVLEVGCGPGGLWFENVDLIPDGIEFVLGDLSIGMVKTALGNIHEARASAGRRVLDLQGGCIDVQALPFPAASFDLVIANHMLYHAPDIDRAIRELYRVVKPDGRVATATNGVGHMRQMGELLENHLPGYRDGHRSQVRRYALENAPELLHMRFRTVEKLIYEDHLHITRVQPLLDYINSLWDAYEPGHPQVYEQITRQVQAEIDQQGYFLINKSQGLLIASP
jgi:SAM-dependent methyltransferase